MCQEFPSSLPSFLLHTHNDLTKDKNVPPTAYPYEPTLNIHAAIVDGKVLSALSFKNSVNICHTF